MPGSNYFCTIPSYNLLIAVNIIVCHGSCIDQCAPEALKKTV